MSTGQATRLWSLALGLAPLGSELCTLNSRKASGRHGADCSAFPGVKASPSARLPQDSGRGRCWLIRYSQALFGTY